MASSHLLEDQALERIGRLRNNGELTDFEIVCRGQSWKVHRLVLCMYSDVLARMCASGFKESVERKVDLSEYDPLLIGRLVDYLYKNDYCDDNDERFELAICHIHIQMCVIADRYDVLGLRERVVEYVHEFLYEWDVGDFIGAPTQVGEVIVAAYEHEEITRDIREALIVNFVDEAVLAIPQGVAAYRQVMTENPGFAMDVTREATERYSGSR